MRRSLSLFVPVLDEAALLPAFLEQTYSDLSASGLDWELLLVNDGSTDESLDIMRSFAATHPGVEVLDLGANLGPGANSHQAYRRASKEFVTYTTVDRFYDTRVLPELLTYMDDADVVSAYRSDLSAHPPLRRIQTMFNVYLQRLLFPYRFVAYHTLQIHRREFIQAIELESRTPFLLSELLFKASAAGLSIKEVSIAYLPRHGGRATGGNPRLIAATMRDILRFWFRWFVLARPVVPTDFASKAGRLGARLSSSVGPGGQESVD